MREKIYVGTNTKMYKTIKQTDSFIRELGDLTRDIDRSRLELFVIPSYTALQNSYREAWEAGILLGAGVSLLLGLWLKRKMLRQAMAFCALAAALTLLVARSGDSYAAAGLTAVGFQKPKGVVQGAARLGAGLLLLGGFYLAVSLVWTKTPAVPFLRNAGVAFLAAGGCPWLFQKWEKRDSNHKN